MQERGSAEEEWGSPTPLPRRLPRPRTGTVAETPPEGHREFGCSRKLFVINHVLKDDVMGEMALPLLPGLRSPGRQAGPGQRSYNPRSLENNV